jgi:hypothetical protein
MFSFAGPTKTLFLLPCDALKNHMLLETLLLSFTSAGSQSIREYAFVGMHRLRPLLLCVSIDRGNDSAVFAREKTTAISNYGTINIQIHDFTPKARKLETAGEMFKERWSTYHCYASCNTFFKVTVLSHTTISPPPVAPIRENAAYGAKTSMFASSHAGWYAGRYE